MSFWKPFTCELEYWMHVFLKGRWQFSYENQNKTWCNISLDRYVNAILIIHKTKITTCDVLGCVADANKIQTTSEKSHSNSFDSASLDGVLYLWIFMFFSFVETTILIKQCPL